MDGPLHGKAVLVTGAAGGSGLLAARALAQTGADLFLSGLNFINLDASSRGIKKDFPVNIEIHTGNPAVQVDAEAIAMACSQAHMFISCTGNLPRGTLDDVEDLDWRKSWEAAVFAPINMTREILGHMGDEGRGLVVLVIDSPARPAGADICATSAGGALKAFVKAQGKAVPKGLKILGLTTGRKLDGAAFSMAISRLACDPDRFATGSLLTVKEVNAT